MKTFMFVVGCSVAIALLGMAVLIWIAVFIEEMDINLANPIDIIADHAEKTAKLFKAMRGKDTK